MRWRGVKRVPRRSWRPLTEAWKERCLHEECDVCTVTGVPEIAKQNVNVAFQVADVAKPLVPVRRIIEKGNKVCFGPNKADNYIESVRSGDRIPLRMNQRGSYLMQVQLSNGERADITVDSGAEENVCPYEFGEYFGLQIPKQWLSLRTATGAVV